MNKIKEKRKNISSKNENVAKSSLEQIGKGKIKNENTTTRDGCEQIEDVVIEFEQESSNGNATGNEDNGVEPTSDKSLGTYTSHKEKQGIQSLESQDSI